jgi:hypothetical protein
VTHLDGVLTQAVKHEKERPQFGPGARVEQGGLTVHREEFVEL